MNEHHEPLGIRILHGVRTHLLGHTAIFAVTFVVTPRLVHGLGTEGYALYTLIWTLINYISLFGMGTGSATQHFTARMTRTNESAQLGSLLRKAFLFQIVAALLGASLNYILHDWIARSLLEMDSSLIGTAATVFASVTAAVPFFFVLRFSNDILYGEQRFGAYNLIHAAQTISISISAAVLLAWGYGLREIAACFVTVLVILSLISLWLVRKTVWPASKSEKDCGIREYAVFSIKVFSSQILWMVTHQGDRVFIGTLLPLSQMGYYVIASTIAQKLNVVCASVAATVFPIFSELHGKGDKERLRRVYLKTTQLSLHLNFLIALLTFILAPQFLTLWLGEEFSRIVTWPLRLIVVANSIGIVCQLPLTLSYGKGVPHWSGIMQAGKTVLLMALWSYLIPRYGILGAALGFALAEWVGTPLFTIYTHRRLLSLGMWEYWKSALWRPVAAASVLAVAGIYTHGRVGTWLELITYSIMGACIYAAVGWWTLDPEARELFRAWWEKYKGGAPKENRTPISALKGPRPNH